MTDQSFTNDSGNQGTSNTSFTSNQDNGSVDNGGAGDDLQQQISVMQKRIGDKDDFINQLKDENQNLREKMSEISTKVESMGSVEEALARMESMKNSNQDTNLDEDTLVSKVLGTLEAKTAEERAEANFKSVSATLTKTYGEDKVDEIVAQAAKENDLSFDDMIALAKKSPNAVYRMLGVKQTNSSVTPSQGTHVGFNNDTQTKEQKLAYFSKLRKENPKEYYKPEVQKAFREACLS